MIAAPALRASVTISGDVVRIGDVVDNAGHRGADCGLSRARSRHHRHAADRAGAFKTLRAHQVIGVDTRELRQIQVTRLARTVDAREIEGQVARALEHRSGLGDAANLSLTFDRDLQDLVLEASNTGALQPVSASLRHAQRPLRRLLRDRE